MKIEDLQIELRPRTNAQALDLGFTLLRSHASAAYLSFLALWLPLMAVVAVLTWFFTGLNELWIFLAWWCKPLLERAPLYVLSRKVFGATVTWQEAVRAWPSQLGGGWLSLLTWRRLIAAGRSMYQPVWQLEGARGSVARSRMQILSRKGTGQSAFLFGLVCFQLEGVLQLGMQGLVSIFLSEGKNANPLFLLNFANDNPSAYANLLLLVFFAVSAAIIAPIYTACGFTLYLNRRASLEAWDIEMQLRQIQPPVAGKPRGRAGLSSAAAVLATSLALMLGLAAATHGSPALAAAPLPSAPTQAKCEFTPETEPSERAPARSPEQAALRAQADAVLASLSPVECVETWQRKSRAKKRKPDQVDFKEPNFNGIAEAVKVILIALAIGGIAWLLIRYRHTFAHWFPQAAPAMATEVAGLDIRVESLPSDVAGAVRRLWQSGQRRAALALLYRATLARLVADNGVQISQGDTEGDCLRRAADAHRARRLGQTRLDLAGAATTLWLGAAYGNRWPGEAEVFDLCGQWETQFASGAGGKP